MFGSGQLEKPKLAAARRTETQSRQLDLGSRIRGHDRRRIGLTYLSNSESTCSSSVDRLISSLSGTMVTRFQGLSVCTHTHTNTVARYTPPKNTHAHTHALFGLSRTGAPLTLASTQLAHARIHSKTMRNSANTFDDDDGGDSEPARIRFARARGHLCVCGRTVQLWRGHRPMAAMVRLGHTRWVLAWMHTLIEDTARALSYLYRIFSQ